MDIDKNHIILMTNDLSIGYSSNKDETVVASNVNIELHKGELIGLVGANGIGKSTLLRTLTRVQKPLKGDILINNKSLTKFSSSQLAK